MLIYYDKIFKDTAEHKINYCTPSIMALLKVNNEDESIEIINNEDNLLSPISLVQIANDESNNAILRT